MEENNVIKYLKISIYKTKIEKNNPNKNITISTKKSANVCKWVGKNLAELLLFLLLESYVSEHHQYSTPTA